MNPIGQCGRIIVCANDDPMMRRNLKMQANKILTIYCQHGSARCSRVSKNLSIIATPFSSFLHRENIVPQQPQMVHDGIRKILIGVELCHTDSSSFVVSDVGFDFLDVLLIISPGGLNIG